VSTRISQKDKKTFFIPKILIVFHIIGCFPFLLIALQRTQIECTYEATWDGPFFTIILGTIGGYLPDRFSFHEITWMERKQKDEFYLALDDDDGKSWLRLHSDTTRESAVWLPRKPKDKLNTEIIRFVRSLRRMWMDSSRHSMNGTFYFGKKKLFAEVKEFSLSPDDALNFGYARAFNVLTFDSTGISGIGGRIVVAKDSVLHYRKVVIYLPNDEIEVTLREQKDDDR